MLCLISENKEVHNRLVHTLKQQNIKRYPAGDIAICNESPSIRNAFPFTAHANNNILLLYSDSIFTTQFFLGVIYNNLHFIKSIVYVDFLKNIEVTNDITLDDTKAIYACMHVEHIQNNDESKILYLDLLNKWYDEKISIKNEKIYTCVHTIMKFWYSHHAQVMLLRNEDNEVLSIALERACVSLTSMPEHNMHYLAQNYTKDFSHYLSLSQSQRNVLYDILKAKLLHANETSQKYLDEKLHLFAELATKNIHKEQNKNLFTRLCQEIQEQLWGEE